MKQTWYTRWLNWRWHPANVVARTRRWWAWRGLS